MELTEPFTELFMYLHAAQSSLTHEVTPTKNNEWDYFILF